MSEPSVLDDIDRWMADEYAGAHVIFGVKARVGWLLVGWMDDVRVEGRGEGEGQRGPGGLAGPFHPSLGWLSAIDASLCLQAAIYAPSLPPSDATVSQSVYRSLDSFCMSMTVLRVYVCLSV